MWRSRREIPGDHPPQASGFNLPLGWPGLGDEVTVVIKQGGSTDRLLGTDQLGLDVLSRVIHGARISLIVAAVTLGIRGTIGVALGLAALVRRVGR